MQDIVTETINTMLKGTSAQGRRMKINCRVKKSVPVPYEEWQRTPNAHEPIISQELWDKAQIHKQAGALDPALQNDICPISQKTQAHLCKLL
nr:recombinase family protein [Ruminococcus sp.]